MGKYQSKASLRSLRQRILIVEDDEKVRDILQRLLALEGHAIYQASNGEEAIAIVEREKEFDAILMDVKMPKMDGVTAYLEMSKTAPVRNLVFMTAFSIGGDLKMILKDDSVEYLQKPCTLQTIKNVINRIRERRENPISLLKYDK